MTDDKKDLDQRKQMSYPLVKCCDMPEELMVEAMESVVSSIEKFPTHYENAAKSIKEAMDKKFGASWHCVIGEGFGVEVTHELKTLLFMFFGGNLACLLFKA
eukprot:GCRY01002873.1.p1 GENE.GCRY01002873.1~~GCRY01002873.1.p1  ORF type:complete len:102 (-),score=6.46 GCRY01002873.1:410-715(-)